MRRDDSKIGIGLTHSVFAAAVLGLTSTLMTAWGISLLGQSPVREGIAFRDRRPLDGEGLGRIVLRWSARPGMTSYQATVYPTCIATEAADKASLEEALPRWARAEVLPWAEGLRPWPEEAGEGASTDVTAFGWPLPALWDARGGHRAARSSLAALADIPMRPLWTGLAANSLLFAAMWWAVLVTPHLAIASARIWRGCCAQCGYSLDGLPPPGAQSPCCPECGAVRPRPARGCGLPALAGAR
jgi:hypothetical protein